MLVDGQPNFILSGSNDTNKPTILQIRSLRHASLGNVDADESAAGPRLRIRTGHFSPKFFLGTKWHDIVLANAYCDNLSADPSPPRADLVVNTISCPDLHAPDLLGVSRFLADRPALPVINRPRKVLKTARDTVYRSLRDLDGLHVPQTLRFTVDAAPDDLAQRLVSFGLGPPLILRRAGTHTGVSVRRADTWGALLTALRSFERGAELFAIAFIDCRDSDGLYNKMRAFFIDGCFHPVANLTSTRWNVHSADRYRIMFVEPDLRRREQHYLNDPEAFLGPDAFAALHQIAAVIKLDFFGIDFAIRPTGEVLVFEANPVMRHNFDHAKTFPYTRPNLQNISGAFREMIKARISSSSHSFAGDQSLRDYNSIA